MSKISIWIIRHQFNQRLYWSYNQVEGNPKWVDGIAFAMTFSDEEKDALTVIPGSGIWLYVGE